MSEVKCKTWEKLRVSRETSVMELLSGRDRPIVILLTFQMIIYGYSCSVKCNPCVDLICPEVHVETQTNPCRMATQAYSIPRNGYYHPPPMFNCPCQFPYLPMPPMAPAPAPSYCVQSVVVGGKSDVSDDRNNSSRSNNGRQGPRPPLNNGLNANPLLGGAADPSSGLGSGGGGGGGGGGFGAFGGIGGIGGLAAGRFAAGTGVDPTRVPPGNNGNPSSSDTDRYERYIERLLNVMRDKSDSDCEPSPMVVMPEPRVRIRKMRRRRQRKYMIESCEEPDPVMVMDDDEEDEPTIVVAQPCRSCCRHRPMCRCRCC